MKKQLLSNQEKEARGLPVHAGRDKGKDIPLVPISDKKFQPDYPSHWKPNHIAFAQAVQSYAHKNGIWSGHYWELLLRGVELFINFDRSQEIIRMIDKKIRQGKNSDSWVELKDKIRVRRDEVDLSNRLINTLNQAISTSFGLSPKGTALLLASLPAENRDSGAQLTEVLESLQDGK